MYKQLLPLCNAHQDVLMLLCKIPLKFVWMTGWHVVAHAMDTIREKTCCNSALAVFGSIVWLQALILDWSPLCVSSANGGQDFCKAACTEDCEKSAIIGQEVPRHCSYHTDTLILHGFFWQALAACRSRSVGAAWHQEVRIWYNARIQHVRVCILLLVLGMVCEYLGSFARWSAVSEEDAAAFSVLALQLLGQYAGMDSWIWLNQ